VSPQASGRRLSSYRRPLFPSMGANEASPAALGAPRRRSWL